MNSRHRLTIELLGLGAWVAALGLVSVRAQDIPPPPPIDGSSSAYGRDSLPPTPDHIRPQARYPQSRRSIVHHYQYPYPGYYHNDDSAGERKCES